MQTMKFSNGYEIPAVGYGTWQSPDSKVTVEGVKAAIYCGYRHIDAAAVYGNEISVGKGIAECGISRDELFITSKVWNTRRGYERTLEAFDKTLNDLQLDYLRSVITNFDTSDDSPLLTDLLTFIGIVLSIILAMLSSNSEKPIWENVYLYIVVILLIIISYSVIMIKIKYTPRNRFYSDVAKSAYEEAAATIKRMKNKQDDC